MKEIAPTHPTIKIESTHSEICKKAAQQIAAAIKINPSLNLGLATGNTAEPLYAELVRMHKVGDIDFSNVQFFNLDEYAGAVPENPISFDHYLHKLFLDKIKAKPENIHLVKCDGSSVEQVSQDGSTISQYDKMIEDLGGIDIQIVGIGGTGHIGFNEKGSKIDELTHKVELDARTIEDNAGLCGGKKNVPSHAYTQGIGTILKAKEIIFLGNGGHKAQVVHDMLEEGEVKELPARALMEHRDKKGSNGVTMYLDTPSAEMLTLEHLEKYAGMNKHAATKFKETFAPIEIALGDGKTLTLPYNADIFIPDVMGVNDIFDPNKEAHVKALREMLKNVKTTYMGAHQDDTEIEVPHEIEKNFDAQKEPLIRFVDDIFHGLKDDKKKKAIYSEAINVVLGAGSDVVSVEDLGNQSLFTMKFATALDNKYQGKQDQDYERKLAAFIQDVKQKSLEGDKTLLTNPFRDFTIQAQQKSSFLSIIATDGAAYTCALKRDGDDAEKTPEALINERKREQREAAKQGGFSVIQLQYPSASVKAQVGQKKSQDIVDSMASIYSAIPNHKIAYSHAPIDTHETHVAVLSLATQALRNADKKPEKFYGMEGWGELGIGDITFDVKAPDWIGGLLKCYDSQIRMQNRPYDKMAVAKMIGNGFMGDHHAEAKEGGVVIGINLSAAIAEDKPLSLKEIVNNAMQEKNKQAMNWLGAFAAPDSIESTFNIVVNWVQRRALGLFQRGMGRLVEPLGNMTL